MITAAHSFSELRFLAPKKILKIFLKTDRNFAEK
jgi:hypothetical protein